jgi:peptidoglycan/LPS O-acetylase OafA/YrhL
VTYVIPGVFADTVRPAVNEPLWSLPYELWLYAVLALIFFAGRRWSGTGIVLGALLLGIAWTATPFLGESEIEHLNSLDFFRLVPSSYQEPCWRSSGHISEGTLWWSEPRDC